jgi:ribosomal protein S18 acetylase RimI-like enzyme
MNIQTRKLHTKDIPHILQAAKDDPGFRVSDTDSPCFWTEHQLKNWIHSNNEDILLISEVDNCHIAGFEFVMVHIPTRTATWQNEFIDSQYRGLGIAHSLRQEMNRQLQKKGVTHVNFLVKANNPNAGTYEKIAHKGDLFSWFWYELD